MTFNGLNPHLFKRSKTSGDKVRAKNGDIDQWRKRVEMASEFTVLDVVFHKTPQSGSRAVALQKSDQLKDHDDAYSEAQGLLRDWMSSALQMEEEEEEDDLRCSTAPACSQPTVPNYDNFNDLYNCLTEEEDLCSVKSFLQDLMEQDVLDSGMMEELVLDVGQSRKKFKDPLVTMEARHKEVRENRARRDAERQRQQGQRVAQRAAREEATRREREEEARKKQEARRQEEMVRQEMVRLRRQMEERKGPEPAIRQSESERMEGQRSPRHLQPAPTQQQQQEAEQLCREQNIQIMLHVSNLKRHFSEWYSVVMDRRLRMGKARALYDWRGKLRAWRAWRTAVWEEQRQREVARMEEKLRTENRQCHLAVESDRRRLLQHCVNEWRLWCRKEREQRQLLARQQETRQKMAALIEAASTGKLAPVVWNRPETTNKENQHRSGSLARAASAPHEDKLPAGTVAEPTQPWQVTRRHAAPTAAQLQDAGQRDVGGGSGCSKSTASPSDRFKNRHAAQQQIIAEQRRLLNTQREQIARLEEEQSMKVLQEEIEKTAQLSEALKQRGSRLKSHESEHMELRERSVSTEADSPGAPQRKAVTRQTCSHPIITAMEARAQQRAERRKEIEALKRKREEEKMAEMRAAEEQRQREEEEEKQRAAERRKEEKRLEREREEEKQRQARRHQELLKLARQHYQRTLLLRRGLAPWKRLIQLQLVNTQLAESHHNLLLLKRCTLGWQQSARETRAAKEASADQLHQHFLLRRSFSCWKSLMDWRLVQEERAERFRRTRTLRRVLPALLNHVTRQRLAERERRELAREHDNRRVLRRCFPAWRRLPGVQRSERQREARREKLGRKVTEVLPDFCRRPV